VCKKGVGAPTGSKKESMITLGSGKPMIGGQDNILFIHSKKFLFEQNIFSQ
jgi:hypothetical protein